MLQRTESHGLLGLGDRIRSMSLSPALQGAGVTVQLSTPSVVVASVTSNDSVTEPSSDMKSRMWFVTVGVRVALTVFVSYPARAARSGLGTISCRQEHPNSVGDRTGFETAI